ncbi:MAG: ribonuclease P protein component [Deltaproteobacteria bacterium]|nr:ribonuclease P protein component [Deltaproteobacteria bacterium]
MRRHEFLRVQGRGSKIRTRSLLVLHLKNKLGNTRLGIAVSRKYGGSVARNRIKRLIREVFRKNRWLFPASADVVVIPKRVRHPVSYQILLDELAQAGKKR